MIVYTGKMWTGGDNDGFGRTIWGFSWRRGGWEHSYRSRCCRPHRESEGSLCLTIRSECCTMEKMKDFALILTVLPLLQENSSVLLKLASPSLWIFSFSLADNWRWQFLQMSWVPSKNCNKFHGKNNNWAYNEQTWASFEQEFSRIS